MPLALAKLIDTHAYERKIGSGILVLGIDNEKYLNHSITHLLMMRALL